MLLCSLTDKNLRRIYRNQYEHPGSAIGYWTEVSLGHVYIVLEPVGFARLTFDDDRYYEFMCFDVPKVVRSPGWDHGHDEESRNGCNTPHVTCHNCNSDSCHFRLCDMFFPSVVGFCLSFCILSCHAFSYHFIMCIAFAYVFVSCIRASSPLSGFQSGAPISSGAPL